MEKRRPYTQNIDYFVTSKKDIFNNLLEQRHKAVIGGVSQPLFTHFTKGPPIGKGAFGQPANPPSTNGTSSSNISSEDTSKKSPEKPTKLQQNAAEDPPQPSAADHDLLSKLADRGYFLRNTAELVRLKPEDEFTGELSVIAAVLAYFNVAYKRVIDFMPMFIEHGFLFGFSVELQNVLLRDLGLIGENGWAKCKEYAVDDPEIEMAREELRVRSKILDDATNILNQF
jgi:hypothetical protein